MQRVSGAATYRRAGVDIAGADRWLARMGPAIRSTHGPEVLKDLGAFAGLLRMPRGLREPVLVASTDGVGTKMKVAALAGRHEGIGVDAVAMNVNDVLVYGARPFLFLDYLAVGRLAPGVMSQLVRGVVTGCRESGCALVGGETAEMPGVYGPGDYDIAGFCVGVAERRALIDGSGVRRGDIIVGLASSGVHANGFSLVRRALSRAALARHARQLLAPTRIYVKPVLAALRRIRLTAIVHVTGGGLTRRIPALTARSGRTAELWRGRWPVPPIFRVIQAAGVSDDDMFHTFNMGLGMALACRPADAGRLIAAMARAGIPAWTVGQVR